MAATTDKRIGRRWMILFAVAVTVPVLLCLSTTLYVSGIFSGSRSTGGLTERFRSHRATFETLRAMALEDPLDGFCLRGANLAETERELPAARLAQYRELMVRVDVHCVWRRVDPSGPADRTGAYVQFTTWAAGLGSETATGIAWSREPFERIQRCEETNWCFPRQRKHRRGETVHFLLEPHWAIFRW